MPRNLKPVPAFANEEEEGLFWEAHDSFDYVDWDNAVRVRLPNLKFSHEAETKAANSRVIQRQLRFDKVSLAGLRHSRESGNPNPR